ECRAHHPRSHDRFGPSVLLCPRQRSGQLHVVGERLGVLRDTDLHYGQCRKCAVLLAMQGRRVSTWSKSVLAGCRNSLERVLDLRSLLLSPMGNQLASWQERRRRLPVSIGCAARRFNLSVEIETGTLHPVGASWSRVQLEAAPCNSNLSPCWSPAPLGASVKPL